ncbi:MAG: aspartate carbamoyltransferase, regulatory subunit [halophilic archaeon J07HX64]|nr:MAG: aspartate carbamoyltransferase, regulatory subunit [halophilic archaeon J07HX64]
MGHKDVAKIEGRELSQSELDVLSLIAPAATINIIRGYEVADKQRVESPGHVSGVLDCSNPDCITTEDEPVDSRFEVLEDGLRCVYCDTIIRDDIADYINV